MPTSMRLKDLLEGIYTGMLPSAYQDVMIASVSSDSRQRQDNGLFVALSGFKFNGEDFIKDALARGAVAIVKKTPGRTIADTVIPEHVCVLDVEDPKAFLRQAALRFFDHPSRRVRTIGVTGTNGKTTITYLLESILNADQKASAVIGTVNYRIAGQVLPSKNTTPGFVENQQYLHQLAEQKIPYCLMETSSHALDQGRVDAIDFAGAIFTNLTQDHLDYHKDMESYFRAKARLFEGLQGSSWAVINADDPYGARLMSMSKGKVISYGISSKADVRAIHIRHALKECAFDIVLPKGAISVKTRFIGDHNIYNILAAAAAAYSEGVALSVIRQGIQALSCVPGRLEPVEAGQEFAVFIDYAHTPDGLINVLKALRAVGPGRIILVFGCGGDRDKGKRPLMAEAACMLADYSVVTSDNPRSEEPEAILQDIKAGFTKDNYEMITDRKEAIARALGLAKAGEIVLIAGKGHENYQIFKDRTVDFNEKQIVTDLLTRA